MRMCSHRSGVVSGKQIKLLWEARPCLFSLLCVTLVSLHAYATPQLPLLTARARQSNRTSSLIWLVSIKEHNKNRDKMAGVKVSTVHKD